MDKYLKIMPFGIILVLSTKCVFMGTSFSDVAFLAVLSALGSYFHFATKEKRVEALEKRQTQIETAFEQKAKEIDDVKNHLSGIKLASAIRPNMGKF